MLKMRSYIKKKKKSAVLCGLSALCLSLVAYAIKHRKISVCMLFAMLIAPLVLFASLHKSVNLAQQDISSVSLAEMPIAASSAKKSVIQIPTGMIKTNPFVPYRDITGNDIVLDVPAFNLVEPPEVINENSDAARVMDTIVSGILYDKFSPSAILNIEGNDYLVKKGDVVNNYKIVNITQDSVTVKLGANIYKAGIGEILTEGSVNYNNVSNLNNKFGGVK